MGVTPDGDAELLRLHRPLVAVPHHGREHLQYQRTGFQGPARSLPPEAPLEDRAVQDVANSREEGPREFLRGECRRSRPRQRAILPTPNGRATCEGKENVPGARY